MSSARVDSQEYVHHLPCIISHDGPAAVSSRFLIDKDDLRPELIASFRGRKLVGVPFELPDGFEAVKIPDLNPIVTKKLTKEEHSDDEDDEKIREQAVSEAKDIEFCSKESNRRRKMISWHIDYAPVQGVSGDPLCNSIARWIALADVVHGDGSPVDVELKPSL